MLKATRRLLTSANSLAQGSAPYWEMMHFSLAYLQKAFARPLEQPEWLDEVSQVALSCIQTAVMCCPGAVAASRASPPADAAATLTFIAQAMASVLCIFHSCSIHVVEPPPVNRVTGLRLDLWPHGLHLSIEALVSVVMFLPATEPMLLSALTAAIICQYEDHASRGALQPHLLVELHCAHLRTSVQANRHWLQQGGDRCDLWDANDPGAQGHSWLVGLMQLVNHPPPPDIQRPPLAAAGPAPPPLLPAGHGSPPRGSALGEAADRDSLGQPEAPPSSQGRRIGPAVEVQVCASDNQGGHGPGRSFEMLQRR